MEIELCLLDDMAEGSMRQFEIAGGTVLVCRVAGELHAVNGICPHRGAQLGQGTLEGDMVVCPWHDWGFDVKTGSGVTNPVACLDQYEVFVKNGKINIVMPDK